MYNLTVLYSKFISEIYNLNSFRYGLIKKSVYDDGFLYKKHLVYNVEFQPLNFISVTNPPFPASGLDKFISPFDLTVWCCALVQIIIIAAFLTWLVYMDRECVSTTAKIGQRTIWIAYSVLMAEQTITILFIFLGQVGQSSGRPYQKGKVAIILLTLWLFGNFFLMVNYYQGSIYSCLAVPLPPRTPRGVEELIDWDIQIVSAAKYITLDGTKGKYLEDILLQQLRMVADNNKKHTKFLTEFMARLLSTHDDKVLKMYEKIIEDNSTRTLSIKVIFDFKESLQRYIKSAKYMGNRHVVMNSGDSPFQVFNFKIMNKNLFTPYLSKELGRLEESGLTQMWMNMRYVAETVSNKAMLLERGKYHEALLSCIGNVKEPPKFYESNPVSLDLILPAFTICAIVLTLGVGVFALENLRLLKQWGKIFVNLGIRLILGTYNIWKTWITLLINSIVKGCNNLIHIVDRC